MPDDPRRCTIEGCLCQSTTQPITEAVYGKKPRHRAGKDYAPHTGRQPIWERLGWPRPKNERKR